MASDGSPTKQKQVDVEQLPIYTHTRVLGADIGVRQQRNEALSRGQEYAGNTATDGVEITAVGEQRLLDQRDRRYIAAWARRNLFGGER